MAEQLLRDEFDLPNAQERNWAVGGHVAGFAGWFIPFGNVLGPLIVWLIKRDQSAFVEEQAREALNFQITMLLYMGIGIVLTFILIGFVLIPALVVFQAVVMVLAALRCSRGEGYRYPFTLRLVS